MHGPSAEQLKAISEHNAQMAAFTRAFPKKKRAGTTTPFYEHSQTGFVVFSDEDFYGVADEMKAIVAKNLPAGVKLVVYTESTNKQYQKQLETAYTKHISKDRLIILQVPSSGTNNFWSRDNLPMPVFENGKFALVNARYYYNFEPDAFFSQLFGVNLLSHNYFWEGGNFMVNSKGNCIVVNRKKAYPGGVSDTGAIPDSIFKDNYGCKTLLRLKHLKGIGHADEVVKFVNDTDILTDTPEYKTQLEQAGFKVHMLPEPDLNYETYANSLIVNDTVFVPVFGEQGDQKALQMYAAFGFKVVGVPSRELATQGQGGIHCITMNYPEASLQSFIGGMQGIVVNH